jgi:hypothetical protein
MRRPFFLTGGLHVLAERPGEFCSRFAFRLVAGGLRMPYSFVTESNVPLQKVVSITTDGAKSMIGQVNGFIALCRQHEDFPDFPSCHCIIHQQVLASNRLNTKTATDIAFKI